MAIRNLTAKDVERAKPGATFTRLRDGNVRGLHLAITPAGTKTWALSYTSPETGRRRYYQLGGLADSKEEETENQLTLAGARAKARTVRDLIENEGIDPIEQDRRDDEAARQAEIDAGTGTVEQLFKLYRDDLNGQGKQGDKYFAIYEGHVRDVIGHLKAREVTKDDVETIIGAVAARHPVQANRVRSVMLAAFNFGLKRYTSAHHPYRLKVAKGELPDFALQYNPVAATIRNPGCEQPRKRNLSKDEVRLLWHSVGVDALSADLAIAVKLLLYTGQRVLEVLQAEWSEFDLDDKLWVIPAERRKSRHKVTVDHVVPLTSTQVKLLKELKGITNHDRWLFPHKDGEKPRGPDAMSQAIYRFCRPGPESQRAGFEPFVAKDLRRTWKTLAGSIGLSLEIRNRIQGHAFSDIGSVHYDQWDYLPEKRRAMSKYARWLDQLVSGETATVVELEASR